MARPKKGAQSIPSFSLSVQERKQLEEFITPLELTPEVRRAHALLWIDAGHSPQTIAKRLHVSRQTIYNWMSGFQKRCNDRHIQARLADKPRSGRPRTLSRVVDPLIAAAVNHAPHEFGYHTSAWNSSLIGRHLREVHHIVVNRASITAALRRLGVRLKILALQPYERESLHQLIAQTGPTKAGRQAQALLWLDDGVSIRKVAVRSQVSRQTVYTWLAQFRARRSEHDTWAPLNTSRTNTREEMMNMGNP